MKEYIELYWSKQNSYVHLDNQLISSNLEFLALYFSVDYKFNQTDFFTQPFNFYSCTFIINDLIHKNFYVGYSEEFYSLDDEESLEDLKLEGNSCKISHDNFVKLAQNWMDMKKKRTPFAIMYRDENDWLHCKGFDSKEEIVANRY